MDDSVEKREMDDSVESPSHYRILGKEVIDIISLVLSPGEMYGFLLGNILKYRIRAGKKDGIEQDIRKAMYYEVELFDKILG